MTSIATLKETVPSLRGDKPRAAGGGGVGLALSMWDTNTYGSALLPDLLTVGGVAATTGLIWEAQDIVVGTNWPERNATAAAALTQTGTDGTVSIGLTAAGNNNSDKLVTGNSSWYFQSAGNGVAAPLANDFIAIALGKYNVPRGVGSRVGVSSSGWMFQHDDGEISLRDGVTSNIVTTGVLPNDRYWFGFAAIDRTRGLAQLWNNGTDDGTAVDISAYATNIGTASDPMAILGGLGEGGWSASGGVQFAAFYSRASWLNLTDLSVMESVARSLQSKIFGFGFSTYQGTQDYPDWVAPSLTAVNVVVEGNTITGTEGLWALNSQAADSIPYALFAANNRYMQIPAAEIPTTGEWTVEFSMFRAAAGAAGTLISISDGTINEKFEIGVNASGQVTVVSDSASGDNGSITGTTNVCAGDAYYAISVAAKNGSLSLKVNGSSEGTDSTSTMPSSPTTFYINSGYTLGSSGLGNWRLRAGTGYGLQVYDTFEH